MGFTGPFLNAGRQFPSSPVPSLIRHGFRERAWRHELTFRVRGHLLAKLTTIMTDGPDGSGRLSRERLCEIAGVERGRHRRWQDAGFLERRGSYGELDVIKAAALNELWRVLKPQAATIVWRQIRGELGHPARCLDAVVDMATRGTVLARSAAQLSRSVPRGVNVRVVDLATPVAVARRRIQEFESLCTGGTDGLAAAAPREPLAAVTRRGGSNSASA